MEVSAPAKVNLSLRVLRRRDDGFHEIETLMVPVTVADTLDIDRTTTPGLHFTCSDPALPVDGANLVVRAAHAFLDALRDRPGAGAGAGIRIHLTKRIPHGAGLGGGSSDAAATLRALNTLFHEPLAPGELARIAATIGSDVPFFLAPGAAWCRGRGEIVEPCASPGVLPLLLLKPPFPVPTPWAYRQWRDSLEIPGVPYTAQRFDWGSLLNDLERPVFEKYIQLAEMKRWFLARPGVGGALMSGSGSTMFAVLRDRASGPPLIEEARAQFGPHVWLALVETR